MTDTENKLARWRRDPRIFVRECFGVTPDKWQDEVLAEFPHQERLCCVACKGPGKSTVMCWCGLNFLATRDHPKIAAMSITRENLQDNLWSEFKLWIDRSPFFRQAFTWTKTRIFAKEHPGNWWISARGWSKTADPKEQADALAGLHAENVLVLMDESGGYPDAVMAAAEGALSTGKELKLFQSGNPTRVEGPLHRACTTDAHLWYVKHITGDPDDPNRSPRVRIKWAREQIQKWGRDNPWVLVNVFGKFPPSSINALLGPDEVREAMQRHLKDDVFNWAQKRLGVDVARFGDDSTIIFPRQGLASFKCVELRGADTREIAARVALAKYKFKSELEFIDATGGYGAGVEDNLIAAGHDPIPVHYSSKASDPRYFNKRSEMWYEMALWIKRGCALPPDQILIRELTTPTYTLHDGKIRIEEKEQIKQRLGFSPNRADALAQTFCIPDVPRKDRMMGGDVGKVKYEYDPYDQTEEQWAASRKR